MLALGAIMAVEKNTPWGRHLSRPLGGALLAIAVVIIGANLWDEQRLPTGKPAASSAQREPQNRSRRRPDPFRSFFGSQQLR